MRMTKMKPVSLVFEQLAVRAFHDRCRHRCYHCCRGRGLQTGYSSCCISPCLAMANEEEKLLLPIHVHVSIAARHFQNDGVKKGWEGREIRDVRQLGFLREARWHKQCAERVCIAVVVVVVFGWGANE